MKVVIPKISTSEFLDMTGPFNDDLYAAFSQYQEAAFKLLDRAIREGRTAQDFIEELRGLA